MLCMISSLDGSAQFDQRSGGLSSPTDVAMLSALRSEADVVLVGAGTARGEGYGPPKKPGLRIGVVSNSGTVDVGTPLFTSGAGFLVLPEDADPVAVDSVRAGTGRVDLAGVLGRLDARVVQLEGGPTLNASFLELDLLDELNLTVSPMLAGGDGVRIVHGAPELGRAYELAHLYEDDGFLFGRWLRRG